MTGYSCEVTSCANGIWGGFGDAHADSRRGEAARDGAADAIRDFGDAGEAESAEDPILLANI